MAQPAFSHESCEARLITGHIIHAAQGVFRVLAGNAAFEATLAASCLLEPRLNDTVLVACLDGGDDLILAVLIRDPAAPARLRVPHHSAIECPGRLTIRAASELDLQSAGQLGLQSQDLQVTAQTATTHAVKLDTVCDSARFCCRALTSLAQNVLSSFRSLTQCLGESRRIVEGADETRCANATLVAEETATVMSQNSLTLVKETARTDALLIQLG